MMDDEEESATIARWVLPAARRRATYPHPNTIARGAEAAPPRRRYGDGVLALGTAQTRRTAAPPPIPAPRPPRTRARASTAPGSQPAPVAAPVAPVAAAVAPVPAAVAPVPAAALGSPAEGDRAAWRWLAVLTAIVAVLVVGAVAYAIVGLGLVAR
jgi:hypothetical protein